MPYKSIVAKGEVNHFEASADAALSPGHLLEVTATGVTKHSVAAGTASPAFAREDDIIGDAATVQYAAGDNVLYIVPNRGSEIYARVAAGAAAIAIGDYVESAGDGTVQVQGASASTSQAQRQSVVGIALEAVDNSGGATEVFIKLRAL